MTHITEYITRQRLEEILGGFGGKTIGVVGDLGLDAYWYADMTRSFLSRETPHHPRPIVREEYSPGAGANVADNLHSLGVGRVVLFSVLGDDWRGLLLRQALKRRGIDTGELIISPQRSTTTFIKPYLMGYDSQQEGPRLDFENAEPLSPALEDALIEQLAAQVTELDALLIADQLDVNGIITDRVREALIGHATTQSHTVFVADSRQRIGLFERMVLKPNWVEAVAAVHPGRDPRTVGYDELGQLGTGLARRNGCPIFITLSENGVLVCADEASHVVPTPPVRPPIDPVGAGDAFVAALAASLSAAATPWESGAVANLAAAVTVEKLNETGTATPDEILDRFELAAVDPEAVR